MVGLRRDGTGWRVGLVGGGVLHAGEIVDPAGAWADAVAALAGVPPLGLIPLLRTIAVVVISAGVARRSGVQP